MALVEYYIGTVGPLYIDDTDPLFAEPTQVALKQDVADGIVEASDSVEAETTFGLSSDAGASDDYSRSDHTHGTPDNPVSGYTGNVTVVTGIGPPPVTATLNFVDGLLDSVT